jgi:hypothetical protein
MTEGIHEITEARSKRATRKPNTTDPQTRADFDAMSNKALAEYLENASNTNA